MLIFPIEFLGILWWPLGPLPRTDRQNAIFQRKDPYNCTCDLTTLSIHSAPSMNEEEAAARHHDSSYYISESPYDARKYLKRAELYTDLNVYDLAAGDAYKALLLTDELRDDCSEYHSRAVEASLATESEEESEHQIRGLTLSAFHVLSKTLIQCGCLRSAHDFIHRGLLLKPDDPDLLSLREEILPSTVNVPPSRSANAIGSLPRRSLIPATLYPWNTFEPDRFSPESLAQLNAALASVAPKLEARATNLPALAPSGAAAASGECPSSVRQLGLFAKADVTPGELVLQERSLLAVCLLADKPLCDCCGAELPVTAAVSNGLPEEDGSGGLACADCEDAVFCSKDCQTLANETYHPIVCDKLVESVARETPPAEAADALYLLLLTRAIALAEARQTHILDLEEVRYLWGDFVSERLPHQSSDASAKLPFSFEYNILYPLNILERMGLDIFETHKRYETWVLNTVYAKFRAVANGSVNARTGRPEVCAVHPLWSLANHSCSPNVRWAWGGEIKLWARKEDEVVKWSGGKRVQDGGISQGEEIVNHYCDINLDVRARREWMMGSLGGLCVCRRCEWESSKASSGGQAT